MGFKKVLPLEHAAIAFGALPPPPPHSALQSRCCLQAKRAQDEVNDTFTPVFMISSAVQLNYFGLSECSERGMCTCTGQDGGGGWGSEESLREISEYPDECDGSPCGCLDFGNPSWHWWHHQLQKKVVPMVGLLSVPYFRVLYFIEISKVLYDYYNH